MQNELCKGVGINSNRRVTFLSNSPSSYSSAKEYFSCCQPNFLSTCVLAIASILFSNYVYFSKINAFLENNIQTFPVIDNVQRENAVYTFQIKSFKHNVILWQVFLKKVIPSNKNLVPNSCEGWKLFVFEIK